MSYTNGLDKPSDYFNTALYTGNYSTNNITSLDFQPDLVWIKKRSDAESHVLTDVVRGTGGNLYSNSTSAEDTGVTTGVTSFNSDGFSLGANNGFNQSGATFASWNWKANGTGVSNTSGSITSTVSANTTSGFSIVSYTGNGTDNATVGHGLSQKPDMVIIKARENTSSWATWHKGLTGSDYLVFLDATDAQAQYSTILKNQSASVLTLGTNSASNANTQGFISYNFHSVKGYSKFGSYTGNGSTNGTFVYTGFKPAMIIAKQSSGGQSWQIHDTARDTFNLATRVLFPNNSSAEQNSSANGALDILSNGFKWRMADADQNGSGSTYIYMAFAENPFVSSSGVPTTAR